MCFEIQSLHEVGSCNVEETIQTIFVGADRNDTRVSCMCAVYDVLWLGTGSGHILCYEVVTHTNAAYGISSGKLDIVVN